MHRRARFHRIIRQISSICIRVSFVQSDSHFIELPQPEYFLFSSLLSNVFHRSLDSSLARNILTSLELQIIHKCMNKILPFVPLETKGLHLPPSFFQNVEASFREANVKLICWSLRKRSFTGITAGLWSQSRNYCGGTSLKCIWRCGGNKIEKWYSGTSDRTVEKSRRLPSNKFK